MGRKMNHKNLVDMSGKNVVVTGAAGILGLQHCFAMAELKANIFVTDITFEKSQEAVNYLKEEFPEGNFFPYQMDVTNESSIRDVAYSIVDKFKTIDVLINNAAIDPKIKLYLHSFFLTYCYKKSNLNITNYLRLTEDISKKS